MNKTAKRSPDQRKQRSPRKLDAKKVLELRAQGVAITDIATHQGVVPSTIWRFLTRDKPQQEALERFKAGRADVLADMQAKSLHVQARILESLDQDGVTDALTASQKASLLVALNAQSGTIYDKERLERGKSTANVGLIFRMMGAALNTAHMEADADSQTDELEGPAGQ